MDGIGRTQGEIWAAQGASRSLAMGFVPGSGLSDIADSFRQGSYLAGLGMLALEAPGGKLLNGLEGAGDFARSLPNLRTGRGYDAGDAPVRINGQWSINDMKQGLLGHPPRGLGSPDIHHGGQMPGGARHEVLPGSHRNNPASHRNSANQGVTPEMRKSDRQLHWWYRAREHGADQSLPDWIYD